MQALHSSPLNSFRVFVFMGIVQYIQGCVSINLCIFSSSGGFGPGSNTFGSPNMGLIVSNPGLLTMFRRLRESLRNSNQYIEFDPRL